MTDILNPVIERINFPKTPPSDLTARTPIHLQVVTLAAFP